MTITDQPVLLANDKNTDIPTNECVVYANVNGGNWMKLHERLMMQPFSALSRSFTSLHPRNIDCLCQIFFFCCHVRGQGKTLFFSRWRIFGSNPLPGCSSAISSIWSVALWLSDCKHETIFVTEKINLNVSSTHYSVFSSLKHSTLLGFFFAAWNTLLCFFVFVFR